jgi:uncharacterized protein with PQ loop repeat
MTRHDTQGIHHFHRRKRCYQTHEPYPHSDKTKRFMDKAIYAISLAGPVMTIPQITKIWLERNASGVSLLSWTSYLVLTFFWLYYGILHKETPIIFNNIIWIFVYILVITGVVIYG